MGGACSSAQSAAVVQSSLKPQPSLADGSVADGKVVHKTTDKQPDDPRGLQMMADGPMQAIVIGAIAIESSNVATMARELESQLDSIKAEGIMTDAGVAYGESFTQLAPLLDTAAAVALPPGCGAAVITIITITSCIINGKINLRLAYTMGERLNQVLHLILKNGMDKKLVGNAVTKKAIDNFCKVCEDTHKLIEEVKEAGWLKRLAYGETRTRLQDTEAALKQVMEDLNLSMNMATFDFIDDAQRTRDEIDDLMKKNGDDRSVDDPEVLQEIMGKLRGNDKLQAQLHQRTIRNQESIARRQMMKMESIDRKLANHSPDDPTEEIRHDQMRNWWKSSFKRSDKVPWKKFDKDFPANLAVEHGFEPDEVQKLQEELRNSDDREALRLAVDETKDSHLSVDEINNAFPKGQRLDQSVRALKEKGRSFKGLKNGLLHMTASHEVAIGREQEVKDLMQKLNSGERVLMVTGGPGEGKRTIVVDAVQSIWNNGDAKAGVYWCDLSDGDRLPSKDALYRKLWDTFRLEKDPRLIDKEAVPLSSWHTIRQEIPKDSQSIVVINGVDMVNKHEDPEVFGALHTELTELVKEVPKLKIIMIGFKEVKFQGIERHLQTKTEHRTTCNIKIGRMSDQGALELLRSFLKPDGGISEADAKVIAKAKGYNATLLKLVGSALASGDMGIEDAKTPTKLAADVLAGDDAVKALKAVEDSVCSVISSFPKFKDQVMQLALMFPAKFTLDDAKAVLNQPALAERTLVQFTNGGLLIAAEHEAKRYKWQGDMWSVAPIVREVASKLRDNPERAADFGLSDDTIELLWSRFVKMSKQHAEADTKLFRKRVNRGFPSIVIHQPNVEQVLRMLCEQPRFASGCMDDVVKLLRLLPYMGGEHDSQLVVRACKAVADTLDGQPTQQALCLAVSAQFMAHDKEDLRENALERVEEALSMLGSAGEGSDKVLVKSLALRKRGVIWRDTFEVDKSCQALKEARDCLASSNLDTPEHQCEEVQVLAELAGTMDYDEKLREEGLQIAQEAMDKAKKVYDGADDHPTKALCSTALGYLKNSMGDHDAAITLHTEARKQREAVYGKSHLMVAQSVQQLAIAYAHRNRDSSNDAEAAETLFLDSLKQRIALQGERSEPVMRTHLQLGELYKKIGRDDDARDHFLKYKEIGLEDMQWPPNHKKIKAVDAHLAEL